MQLSNQGGSLITKPKMGRPKIEIDWVEFDKLCFIQCTLAEIAAWHACSEDTIERAVKDTHDVTFAEYYKEKSANGRSSLRRRMYQAALDEGNTGMMIWLSKQYLGHSERQETITHNHHTVENKGITVDEIKKLATEDKFIAIDAEYTVKEPERETDN